MPAIKKRITAAYMEREQKRNEQNGEGTIMDQKGDRENTPPQSRPPPSATQGGTESPLKRKTPPVSSLLKGLDGEVLVEKRKRTVPPAELKLEAWLDNHLEKKADSMLSLIKLYQFYTDMCQQEESQVVEMDIFKTMLRNKFGKEFGLKESSLYSGLVKTSKPKKKSVVAPSLGYKMKDIIEEALKTSGNPSKGMAFSWVKKFVANKYPALQIEVRPRFLRHALEREIYAGRVELVKGIGFCGFYRQPGPPDVEEEPKLKKKSQKKVKKGEESADSAEDVNVETDKDEENKTTNPGEKTGEKTKKDKKGKSTENETEADKEEEEKTTEDKKSKKKKKKGVKKRRVAQHSNYGNPTTLLDVFPLALTYMAEPKEASFAKIRKYLEKYYSLSDIDSKLKRCIEHGCETGMWGRVSGAGAAGSFQLLIDSFDPGQTESMADMVCSAIIACNEPKISSVKLLKSYTCEYHPEFNIDTRPHLFKHALEKAEKTNLIRRVSGIGMTGSFQLVDQFTPSPLILAGDEEDDDYVDDVNDDGDFKKTEVYVVRKTKSGRSAPLQRTEIDYTPSRGKNVRSGARGKSKSTQKKPHAKLKYREESSEEESSSAEEIDSDLEGYRPRPSKSRSGGQKKAVAKTASRKPLSKPSAGKASSQKKGKPAQKSPQKRQATAKNIKEAVSISQPSKPSRNSTSNSPVKSQAKKRSSTPRNEDSEEDYEEEEEKSPAKKSRNAKASRNSRRDQSPELSSGRTPRSALRNERRSYKEESDFEDDEEI